MLFFIFLLCFSSNFLFISAEDNDTVAIIMTRKKPCTLQPTYTFTEGHTVTLLTKWSNNSTYINHGWWKLKNHTIAKFTESHKMVVNKSIEGIWMFEFLYLKGVTDLYSTSINEYPHKTYKGKEHAVAICSTNVTIIEPAKYLDINDADRYKIIMIAEAVIGVIIIGAQAAYIVYLKSKARKLNRHNNLSKKTEHAEVDTTRYCADPGKKVVKPALVNEINRESIIYEAPNIELPDRLPIIQPPQPPAISTMPRTPRPDQHNRIAPQTCHAQDILAAALNRPGRGPNSEHHTIPRPKQTGREIHLANRPPLPLPPNEANCQELYEEMEPDDNTYEPPPIMNTLPPRPNIPKKAAKLLDIQKEPQKLRCMSKPAVTQKPQRPPSNAIPAKNELEQVFRRRNNVMQVPIVSIPDANSSGAMPPKRRPLPVAKSMLKGPPIPPAPQPVPEEAYYSYSNEKQDSSDEEWTYEPLKPMNSYNNDMNIYNI